MANSIIDKLFSTDIGKHVYSLATSAIDKYKMRELLCRGVLLGFSGGADSVMLLCVLLRYRAQIGVEFPILTFHVNHGIRGAEADRDEDFSRDFSARFGVEFASVGLDVPTMSAQMKMGVEEAARFARYSEFSKIISSRNDIDVIAIAHNATDNIETMLFNMCRGCASDGAAGISAVRDNILRPLIYVPKADIVSALDAAGIEYVTDSTNFSVEYTRNYIRHSILPLLRKLNPKLESAFSNLSDSLREDGEYLDSIVSNIYEGIVRNGQASRDNIISLHTAELSRFLVRFADYSGATLTHRHICSIMDRLKGDNFVISVGGGYDFVCERGICSFKEHRRNNQATEFHQSLISGTNKLDGYSGIISIGENITLSSPIVYKISIQADLSSAIIVGGLYVRFREPGDAYYYGGMTHRLKKVFNDRNIPPSLRDRIPVICDEKGIVWVPGLGVRDDGVEPLNAERLPIFFVVSEDLEGDPLYTARYFE